MAQRLREIEMVAGDTGPPLRLSLTDPNNNDAPIDISAAGTVVRFKMRAVPQGGETTTIKATIVCSKLAGRVLEDKSITTAAPYNVAGAGGRCQVDWTLASLDTAGKYEAEVEITFDTGIVQTMTRKLRIRIREQFT